MNESLNRLADNTAKVARIEEEGESFLGEQWETADDFPLLNGGKLEEENPHRVVVEKKREVIRGRVVGMRTGEGFRMEGWWRKISVFPLTSKEIPYNQKRFAWKVRSRTLPVFRYLEKRNRNLYERKKCMLCEAEKEETLEHIFVECEGTRVFREELRKKIQKILPTKRDGGIWKLWIGGLEQEGRVDETGEMEGSIYLKIPKRIKQELGKQGLKRKRKIEVGYSLVVCQLEAYEEMWKRETRN